MLRILLTQKGQRVDEISDFNRLWEEIVGFKEKNKAKESPDFMGLQDKGGRMFLLALYDEDYWVLEVLQEDWGTQFGKIDLAKGFDVKNALLSDQDLKETLKTLVTEGKLSMPSDARKPG